MTKWSRAVKRIFSRISLVAAAPVPPQDATPEGLYKAVLELRGERL